MSHSSIDLSGIAPASPTVTTARPTSSRLRLLMVALGLVQLMISLDTTIITVALPSAQRSLGFSDGDRQWPLTGYALAFGSLLLLTGALADRYGRRRVLLAGLELFALASAVAGAAPTFAVLVVARIAQGVGAALLAPTALSLISTTFTEPGQRARAFGVFGAVSMLGTTTGLLLGGVLSELLSWRWTMYLNLFLALPAIALAAALVAPGRTRPDGRLGWSGAAAVTSGLFSLVLGTSRAQSDGWGSPWTLGPLLAAVVLLVAFVLGQRTAAHPLLPLGIVTDRSRAGALAALLVSSAGLFATFLLLPFYLQGSLGYGQVRTGLAFLPVPVCLALSALVLAPRLASRLGVRGVVPLGLALVGASLLLLARLDFHSSYAGGLLPTLVGVGTGVGLVLPIATATATERVGDAQASAAAALVNTAQQAGGAVGVAVLNTVAASTAAAAVTALPVAQALVRGYTTGFAWTAVLFLAGAALTALVLPRRQVRL